MTIKMLGGAAALAFALCLQSGAQSTTDMAALKGLAPVTTLAKTDAGKAALGANYVVTGGIQTGAIVLPTLLPFAEQQQQALRDVFITSGDLAQLADGLGTTLGSAYVARAHYIDRKNFTSISPTVAALILYANATSGGNSNSGSHSHVASLCSLYGLSHTVSTRQSRPCSSDERSSLASLSHL